ncbi:hypothetical protein [Vibrio sp. D431a]|uniref:hypothetical protein n=1 Tax=Vibrio sp. D431a TaxID=2837388 RepID=UPI002555CAFA|nr:hypothetical protein [Vibrio sp. D431a]MDK9793252.1 hypothetical protein [Vibrio sp. D431a]
MSISVEIFVIKPLEHYLYLPKNLGKSRPNYTLIIKMNISDELSSALALRNEAVRYLGQAASLVESHDELSAEIAVVNEMGLMISGFNDFEVDDFNGISRDAIDLFNCIINYVKFLKHKIQQ